MSDVRDWDGRRPGLCRAAIEGAVICACATAIGLGVNTTRRLPLALAGPVPQSTESCSAPDALDAQPVPFIDPRLAAQRHGAPGVVFADARPRQDFMVAHVAGAVSLPADDLHFDPQRLAAVRGANLVVAYCDRPQCGLSTRLGQRLRAIGVADVRVLRDGWFAWFAAGYPAQSGGF
jgi:rhodanese-related sulfurtransferase